MNKLAQECPKCRADLVNRLGIYECPECNFIADMAGTAAEEDKSDESKSSRDPRFDRGDLTSLLGKHDNKPNEIPRGSRRHR